MNTFRATMRWILLAAAIVLMPLAAIAQDFGKGLAAYEAGDYATALKEWRPLAQQGQAEAQYRVGIMYDRGLGVRATAGKAARWYKLAAEQGLADAQYKLGHMYDGGWGVHENDAEAVRWFRLAANQGHAEAQTDLGVMYHHGRGVPQDYVLAHMWYNIGAAGGNAVSERKRDQVTEKMTPDQIAEAERRARVCMESNYKDCD